MSSTYGQQSTYGTTNANIRLAMDDMIVKYPDRQFPLLKRLNGSIFNKEITGPEVRWQERDLRGVRTTVASATVAASSAPTIQVADAGIFNVDDQLQTKGGEVYIVKEINAGIELVLELWTGTAAAFTLSDTVYRVGVASPEGKLADNMVISGVDELYNYTQIFEDVVEMSDSEYKSVIQGNETSVQVLERKQKELMELLQNRIMLGTRNRDVANKRSSLGGVKYFVDTYAPTNAFNFGGATTWNTDSAVRNAFDNALQPIIDRMGSKPAIWLGTQAMRKLTNTETTLIRTTNTSDVRGTAMPQKYLSQMGEIDLVLINDRTGMMNDLIFFVDESNIGYKAKKGRAWFSEEKPYAGDGHLWQVVGEYTVKVQTPKLMSYISNLGLVDSRGAI